MKHTTKTLLDGERYDFTLTGSAVVRVGSNKRFRVEFRIDNGPLRGKRLTQDFGKANRADYEALCRVLGVGPTDMGSWAKAERVGRFSGLVRATREWYDAYFQRWIPEAEKRPDVDYPKHRFKYRFTEFEAPSNPAELKLASNFHNRRKR